MADVVVEHAGKRKVLPDDVARRLAKDGIVRIVEGAPTSAPAPAAEEPGILDSIGEAITGDKRRTATTEAASDITLSPEWNAIQNTGLAGAAKAETPGGVIKRAALSAVDAATGGVLSGVRRAGQMVASPGEQIEMIAAQNPSIQWQRDEKGNRFFVSPTDGLTYSEQPGLRATDTPRIAANVGAFLPAGAAATVPALLAAGAGTQAVLEAGQAASGGTFSPGEVALAGGLQAIAPAIGAVRAARAVAPVVDDAAKAATVADDVARVADVAADGGQAATKIEGIARPPAPAPMPDDELGALVRQAVGGSESAKMRLAEHMAVNPDAVAAARRLGVEVPADVLSDSQQIRAAIGGVRAKTGGEAEAAWRATVGAAVDKADEAIQAIDGAPSPDAVSQGVRARLRDSREALKAEAKALYNDVDAAIKPAARITADNVDDIIKRTIENVDGDLLVLSPGEKMMLDLANKAKAAPGEPAATFEGLRRIKQALQDTIRRGEGPFTGANQRRLRELESALKADELANAERLGGAEIRQKVHAAHRMTAKQKALEERIVKAFGEETDGSIAALMRGAVTDAAAGNSAKLTKLLKAVPEEMHGEVLMTALASSTRSKSGAEAGKFGFAEFAKSYQGLRAKGNEGVYRTIAKAIGPQRERVLRDLYEISRRITDARAAVKETGKANQPFLQALNAENLLQRVFSSSFGRAAAASAGATAGGGLGAMGAAALVERLAQGGKDVMIKAGQLMTSPEFQSLAVESATKPQVSRAAVRKVAASRPWREYAKAANLPRTPAEAERWLTAAAQAGRQEIGQ